MNKLFDFLFPKPKPVNHEQYLSLPMNQGKMDSCYACSPVSGAEMVLHQNGYENIDLSEMWLYMKAEEIDNHAPQGTHAKAILTVLKKIGVPFEKVWIYKDDFDNPGSPTKPYEPLFKIKSCHRVKSIKQLHKALVAKNTFVFGAVRIYQGCLTEKHWDKPRGCRIGLHAVHFYGFDDVVYFRNSWGKDWGESGSGTMTEEFYKKNAVDIWAAKMEIK